MKKTKIKLFIEVLFRTSLDIYDDKRGNLKSHRTKMVLLRGYMQILKLSSSENAKNYEDKVENLKYHRKYN